MAIEKEINGYWLDHLDTVEDALALAEKEHATETIAFLKHRKEQLERKLYQKPPLISE